MGLLDVPGPVFAGVDTLMAHALPPVARLALWGLAAALLSMEFYRWLSPQARIAAARTELRQVQRELSHYDGDLAGARRLMARVLGTAVRRLALVAPAAIAASLPVVCLLVWVDAHYGRRFPNAGEAAEPQVVPTHFEAAWFANEEAPGGYFIVTRGDGDPVVKMAIPVAVNAVTKWRWWNALVGSPVGYLPAAAPVEVVHLDFPHKEVISLGPQWLRTWEVPFFTALVAGALALKWARRIA